MKKLAGNGTNAKMFWQLLYPFLMFILVRSIALSLAMNLYVFLAERFPEWELLVYDEAGEVAGIAGNGIAALQIIGFAAGAAVIWKTARELLAKAAEAQVLKAGISEEEKPAGDGAPGRLRGGKESAADYLLLGAATMCAMLGLNMLLDLAGLMDISAAYQQVERQQYSADLWMGLPLYVLVAPAAEELLFRGIIYNRLKSAAKPLTAMLLAAVFFGVYHGNVVQGVYGFFMACVIIYGYEYFGDFRVPLAMHALVNLCSYLLGNTALAVSGFICWPVCAACLCLAAGGLWMLNRRRKVF